MTRNFEHLQREYDNLLNSQVFNEEDLDYSIFDQHVHYLEKISELSNSVVMVFDLFKREHIFVSRNISQMLSLDFDKSKGAPGYVNEHIHPDDFYELFETGLYFLRFGMSLPVDLKKKGKLINEYRIIDDNGNSTRIIEQQMCLECDKKGNIWLALGIMDISPDQAPDAGFRSRLIDLNKNEIYMFPPPNKEAMLTSREKEVLQLISKGLISKEIADKLFISVNTVNTHRQRILEKLNVKNSHEAIKYLSKHGLL